MSLVASGHHYIRSALGAEVLFDLKRDPYERYDLMQSTEGNLQVAVFRKKLLEVLTENRGSVEAEASYLRDYRKSLEALLRQSDPQLSSAPEQGRQDAARDVSSRSTPGHHPAGALRIASDR